MWGFLLTVNSVFFVINMAFVLHWFSVGSPAVFLNGVAAMTCGWAIGVLLGGEEMREVDEAIQDLARYIRCVSDPELQRLCLAAADNPDFQKAFGSSEHHHAYQGGLAVHTAEVLRYAVGMAPSGVNTDVLIPAAVWHDFAKIWEYEEKDGKIEKTEYRQIIRHVAGSHAEFYRKASKTSVDEKILDQIAHCILAHHGRLEWGSPVEPQTVEAHCLHYADMLSSRFGEGARRSEDVLELRKSG